MGIDELLHRQCTVLEALLEKLTAMERHLWRIDTTLSSMAGDMETLASDMHIVRSLRAD